MLTYQIRFQSCFMQNKIRKGIVGRALSQSKLEAKQHRFAIFARARKADPLQQPDGCYVISLRFRNNSLHTSAGERVFHKAPHSFGSVAAPPVHGAHVVADLDDSFQIRWSFESTFTDKD